MAIQADHPFHVAIVGGGLCGLALAIALTRRSIPYTIYEARASFTEIGAGINLAPNSLEAFNLIDPSLGDVIFTLATRNPPGRENVWLSVRLGTPTELFQDAELIVDIEAPPTGNTTVSRNELLQEMASRIPRERARFDKKLVAFDQSEHDARMTFEDGSQESASLVIACDGAHSAMRRLLLGPDNPAASAHYSQMGGYRALFPMEKHEEAVGKEMAHSSQIWCGPSGYIIIYPINGGKDVNIGVWTWKKGDWKHDTWVLNNQKTQMLQDYSSWGPTVQKMLGMMSDETQFWATHHHSAKPVSYFRGRACIIGDAAHSMGPHQGQGAAQSMEDACVMAQVLQGLHSQSEELGPLRRERIEAVLTGYEAVRRARFERVLDTSFEAMSFWSDFWRPELTEADLEQFRKDAFERMRWIWDARLEEQAERVRVLARKTLQGGAEHGDVQSSLSG